MSPVARGRSVDGEGVGADQEELNSGGGELGQDVAEVGIQQRTLPGKPRNPGLIATSSRAVRRGSWPGGRFLAPVPGASSAARCASRSPRFASLLVTAALFSSSVTQKVGREAGAAALAHPGSFYHEPRTGPNGVRVEKTAPGAVAIRLLERLWGCPRLMAVGFGAGPISG